MRATLITFTYWNNYWWNLWWTSHSSCDGHRLLADIGRWTMRFFVVTAQLRKSLSFLKPSQAEFRSIICIKTHQVPFTSILAFLENYISNFVLTIAVACITGRRINVAHLIIRTYMFFLCRKHRSTVWEKVNIFKMFKMCL